MSYLELHQRCEIDHLLKQGASITEIARNIGVHKSTVSREISRNSDQRSSEYKVRLAQNKYQDRQSKKLKSIRFTQQVRNFTIQWIKEDYSPEQIVGYSKSLGVPCVSTERIYQFICHF